MDIYSIYCATNKINGKRYIGFDSSWPQRQLDHHKNSRYAYRTEALYHAIRKHGWDAFDWNVIYQSPDKSHTKNEMESYFIVEYNTHVDDGCGYNMTSGGDGGNRMSAAARAKMGWSRGLKLDPCSQERRDAISAAKKAQRLKWSEADKERIRQTRLGSKASEDTIRKKSKRYVATSPDGVEYRFYNLNRFAKEHSLNQGAMSGLCVGRLEYYKGWKCRFDLESGYSSLGRSGNFASCITD